MTHGIRHPPEIIWLCEQAIELLTALKEMAAGERGQRIPAIRGVLAEIERRLEEVDIRTPIFAEEQGWMVNAASALQSIDMDRGGPHVGRYVDRAVADLRRLAGEPE